MRVDVEALALYGFTTINSGEVAMLSFDVDCDLKHAIGLLQQTCFEKDRLAVNGLPVPSFFSESAGQPLELDVDVHQIVLPGVRLRKDLVKKSRRDFVYDEDALARLVYREHAPFREGERAVRAPAELNRAYRAVCRHARGVTVLGYVPEHIEYGIALTAISLVTAAARLGRIRADAVDSFGEVPERWFRASRLSPLAARMAAISQDLGNFDLQLTFGLQMPEVVLESYRSSLLVSLGLAGGDLGQLRAAVDGRKGVLAAARERRTSVLEQAWTIAGAWISFVAVPLGLVFGFLGAHVSETYGSSSPYTIFSRHFVPFYLTIGGLLLLGLAVILVFLRYALSATPPSLVDAGEGPLKRSDAAEGRVS